MGFKGEAVEKDIRDLRLELEDDSVYMLDSNVRRGMEKRLIHLDGVKYVEENGYTPERENR